MLLKIWRWVQYLILTLVTFGLTAFTWIFSIPLCMFFVNKDGNLRGWLYYLQSFDATLDEGWENPGYGYKLSWNILGMTIKVPIWWQRTKWLCRNPAYGFSYWIVGIPMNLDDWTITEFSDYWFKAVSKDGYFNYYYSGPYGQLKIGWKAWNYFDSSTGKWKENYQWGPEMRTMLCCTPTPFKRTSVPLTQQ